MSERKLEAKDMGREVLIEYALEMEAMQTVRIDIILEIQGFRNKLRRVLGLLRFRDILAEVEHVLDYNMVNEETRLDIQSVELTHLIGFKKAMFTGFTTVDEGVHVFRAIMDKEVYNSCQLRLRIHTLYN